MLSLDSQRVFRNLPMSCFALTYNSVFFFLICFCFVLFCFDIYITNHSMTGSLENSEFCFPRVSTKFTVPPGTSH